MTAGRGHTAADRTLNGAPSDSCRLVPPPARPFDEEARRAVCSARRGGDRAGPADARDPRGRPARPGAGGARRRPLRGAEERSGPNSTSTSRGLCTLVSLAYTAVTDAGLARPRRPHRASRSCTSGRRPPTRAWPTSRGMTKLQESWGSTSGTSTPQVTGSGLVHLAGMKRAGAAQPGLPAADRRGHGPDGRAGRAPRAAGLPHRAHRRRAVVDHFERPCPLA